MSSKWPARSGVWTTVMMPPYVITRTSMPCALVSVNSSRLRLPAEDAARVGWIVGQVPAAGEFTVHPHRDRAAKWCDTGHWIAVGIAARIVEAATAHVIAIVRHRRVAILAIQTLRRCLDEKCCAGDVTRVEPGGPRNAVLEEPAAGSVQFVIAEDGPLFERPLGIVDGGRRHAGDPDAPSVGQRRSCRRLAFYDERREVALEDGVFRILESRRQHQRSRGGLVRHRDR